MKGTKKIILCGGIDVGGTKIASALFTKDGKMTGREKVPIDKGSAEKPARQIISIIHRLAAEARKKGGEIKAIGICIPGVVFQKSGLVWAPNVSGWDHFPLAARLREKTRIPIILDSDRSAYVLGEQWRGVAKGKKDVVFLAVGTGIGAGIMAGGRLIRGSEDIAGAVGWFALNPYPKPEYAEMGCFEAEASGASLGRKARQLLKAGAPSAMKKLSKGNLENITAEEVVNAARTGDRLACFLIDSTISYLAMGIANIVSILNPDVIVLGGGLFQAGELLLKPIREEFKRWAQPLAAKKVKIELSSLGDNTGLYGAGKLAWNSLEAR